MGQYHAIYNTDKKEWFSLGEGLKLVEWGGSLTSLGLFLLLSNSTGGTGRGLGDINYANVQNNPDKSAVRSSIEEVELVAGRWVGDRIVVQGDYATEESPGYIPLNDEYDSYSDISSLVYDALQNDFKLR